MPVQNIKAMDPALYRNGSLSIGSAPAITPTNLSATSPTKTVSNPPIKLPPAGNTFVSNQIPSQSTTQPTISTPNNVTTGGAPITNFSNSDTNLSKLPVVASSPENAPTSATDQAFAAYIKSLQPNQDVTDAKTAYNNFTANENLGVSNLEGQGRGIPLTLIRGQQAKLKAQAEPEATRLQNAIGIAQDSATSISNAAKANADYLQTKDTNALNLAKPVGISNTSTPYAYNSSTGKYEPVASTAGSVAGVGGLTPDTTQFWSDVAPTGVNLNNILPSLGMGSAAVATKQAILEKVASNAKTLGIDGGTWGAMLTDSKAKDAAYTAAQKQGTQTQINENTANKNFDQLVGLSAKLPTSVLQTGIPLLQNWINTGAVSLSGNADVNNFLGTLTTALTEYAKVVSGATTGAGVTEGANAAAQKLLQGGLSTDAIKSFVANAKKEMGNRTSSYDDALKSLFGNIKVLTDNSGGLGVDTTSTSTGGLSVPTDDWGDIFSQ